MFDRLLLERFERCSVVLVLIENGEFFFLTYLSFFHVLLNAALYIINLHVVGSSVIACKGSKPELYIYLLSCIVLSEFTSPYFAGIHMDIQVSLSLHRVHEMLVRTPDHTAGCIASSWM